MKRQRSRGRSHKPGMQNPNRAYESAGPDIKVRGSAQTIMEKYQQLGRDCMASGDRILAENYFQHSEHYLRLIKAIQPNFVPRSEFAIAGIPSENEDDVEDNENGENEGENLDENSSEETEERPNRDFRERTYDNNRFNNNRNRNRNRNDRNDRNDNRGDRNDRYRQDRGERPQTENTSDSNIENASPVQVETTQAFEENTQEAPQKSRGPRLRGLRVPRKPREKNEGEKPEGFGDEMPAFLQTPVISADAE